jgi:multimeric flavodoxin WrbA/nitrite reductase/ring-hydroxylating ferredoxin subunit
MPEPRWIDLGPVETLRLAPLQQVVVERTPIALSFADGRFAAVSGVCNHVGGPLGHGRLDGDYVVCPWHNWKFHRATGEGEPGFEEDRVPRYELREEGGRLLLDLASATARHKKKHPPHALARPVGPREPGPLRVAGISTTNMDVAYPRYSTSDALLEAALAHAAERGLATRLLRLRELRFRACEGYYSKAARACTWPCSITEMDASDQMDQVYEAMVFWADVIVVATPIRWGAASALYFKMAERLNCVQNQMTLRNRVLLHNKVAAFIITGGQDNVQGVAGQALSFFAELGFHFPPFPFVAHSRGWTAEDMEANVAYVRGSEALREGAAALLDRAADLAARLIASEPQPHDHRAGRKASGLLTATPAGDAGPAAPDLTPASTRPRA